MPWTVDSPPDLAKNWPAEAKRKCVEAANAVLQEGGTDEQAIQACIRNAGMSEQKAVWSTAYINDLPDGSFLYILPGGAKDSEGKTTPRSLRMFPYRDSGGNIDLPHLRNALARIPQSNRINQDVKNRLMARARRILQEQKKAMDDELLIAFGGEIKALGDGKIGGYLVRFTDAGHPDLEGDYFTIETDFDADEGDAVTVYYAHGQDKTIGTRKIGKGNIAFHDVGVWVEAQLKLRDEYERAIYDMARAQKLGWSSGSLVHLVERETKGAASWIKHWPLGKDASLTPTPAAGPDLTQVTTFKMWQEATPSLKALMPEALGDSAAQDATVKDVDANVNIQQETKMEKDEIKAMLDEWQAEQDAKKQAEAEQEVKIQERIEAEVKAQREEWEKSLEITNDPGYSMPNVAKHADAWKYDNYPAEDLAMAVELVCKAHDKTPRQLNPTMVKALALRLESDEAKDETRYAHGQVDPMTGEVKTYAAPGPLRYASNAMKGADIKADETNFSTNASYGDEWIGVAYSGTLWEAVRHETVIASLLPTFEFPAGAESLVIPVQSTDPVWYLVAQAGDPASATATFTNTVPAKALGTANATMTLGKLGSSTLYTGEMVEDAVLPFVGQLRSQIAISGAEYLESALIDGDTATTTTTNINDIAGTPASTDWFLIWDGFRKSCLVTTTANSRSGGTLDEEDFLETVKLMGAAGKTGHDPRRTGFILDPNAYWKALTLAKVNTRDVNSQMTIESGMLTNVYGYRVYRSYSMHYSGRANTSYEYKANTAGKVDIDTAANNTTGALLAVRWDHWRLGFRRRMTTEIERVPRADGWEITTLMRAGLKQRDTEASAITYNVTV